ncbi:copper amine oxidase N-terminal domain-containing protein [Heliorestis convoluta]|uniref:Copper amine oxidase-like domain-containing protein n=1 Tax=Heliorestis convoluta TaxID=356322 RepID=A0A5Q2N0F8_9FIRM|nr:copper amine oxidase N-terminal domain-containing protein [Heliorestis convoluta]QGG47233.1 copper amine oxidase-like domain-containing protein [Heliorestis convoluta]
MKQKKYIVLALLLFFSIMVVTSAIAAPPTVFINEVPLLSESPAVIENNRTLVPMRAIFEALGQTVTWNAEERSVTSGHIWLQIDNREARVGDKIIELDVAATIINDRTYVPLRFIAESLDKKVAWDGEQRRVDINCKPLEDSLIEFDLEKVFYEEGILKAEGIFYNRGNDTITKVNYIDIKIYMANKDGEQAVVADHRFENIPVQLKPGENVAYVFIFAGVPEYKDATSWGFDAYDLDYESTK